MSVRNFHFHTVADLVAEARKVTDSGWQTGGHYSPLSYREVLDRMLQGDLRHVSPAEAIMDQVNASADWSATKKQWRRNVYGAFPCVPAYLANDPLPMRSLINVETQGLPIGLWVDVVSSAGVSLEKLLRRGIAVLSLAMYLQRFRPVTLHVLVSTCNQGSVCLNLETTPFDVSVAADFLCNGETARLPMYAILRRATNAYLGSIQTDEEVIRQTWNIPPGDLVLTGTHLFDTDILNDPVAWVNKTSNKLTLNKLTGELSNEN